MKRNRIIFDLIAVAVTFLLFFGAGLQDAYLVWATGEEPEDTQLNVNIDAVFDEYRPGDRVNYIVTITNEGPENLVNLVIVDSLTGFTQIINELPADESVTFDDCTYDIPANYDGEQLYNALYAYDELDNLLGSAESMVAVSATTGEQEKFDEPEQTSEGNPPEEEENNGPTDTLTSGRQFAPVAPSALGEGPLLLAATPAPPKTYEDTIAVSKTAGRVNGCRAYEVTLNITGTPPEKPVDVILVIDTSGSMNEGSPKSALTYAKEAAINFADQVLQNPNNRVAVVTYDYQGHKDNQGVPYNKQSSWRAGNLERDSRIVSDFTNLFTGTNGIRKIINDITAEGGTNTEAGFIRARNLMSSNGRASANKAIVFLTDGLPTVSIGRAYGPNDPTKHNDHTRAAYGAGQSCHSLGYQVFAVNLLTAVPSSSLWVAQDTMNKASNAGYYETYESADLSGIYGQISQQINYSATNALVTDKIPSNFEFVRFVSHSQGAAPVYNSGMVTWNAGTIGTGATLKYVIKAKETFLGGSSVATNDWAKLTYTDINGNSNMEKLFNIPQVKVPGPLTVNAGPDQMINLGDSISIGQNLAVSGGTEPYTYEWSANSTVFSTNRNPSVSPGEDTTYTVMVKDSYGCPHSDEMKVTVSRGTITVNKVVEKGSKTKKFSIYVEGKGRRWNMLLADGDSAQITGLEPGDYTIGEVVAMDYKLVSISQSPVTISAGQPDAIVTITNKKMNGGWFRDDDEETNTFKMAATGLLGDNGPNFGPMAKGIALPGTAMGSLLSAGLVAALMHSPLSRKHKKKH